MANSASRGYTFGATELVTNAKLHALVDSATLTIDTVSGSALTYLASTPVAAGRFPYANIAMSLASGNRVYFNGTQLIGIAS